MKESGIEIKLIDIPEILMRDEGDMGDIPELAEDIRDNGLINAIKVRPKGDRFELVAGYRRLKAYEYLGKEAIRCSVEELTDDQALSIMASENLFREDVDPVDEAIFIAKLVDTGKWDAERLAYLFHRSVNWIKDRLEILDYPEYLIAHVKTKQISLGVAKFLGAIKDEGYRKMYVDQAAQYGTTVLQAEYIYKQWAAGLLAPSETIAPPNNSELRGEQPSVKWTCRKCGRPAEAPNVESVTIHRECPPDEEEAE